MHAKIAVLNGLIQISFSEQLGLKIVNITKIKAGVFSGPTAIFTAVAGFDPQSKRLMLFDLVNNLLLQCESK